MTTEKQTVNVNNSNEDIREALKAAGVKVAKSWSRDILIRKAEEIGIWVQVKHSVVPDSYKTKYGPAQNCGDDIAELLKGEDVEQIAKENGIDLSRWEGRNPGMVRMNLGNVLRGRARRGEYVRIGEVEYNVEAKVA